MTAFTVFFASASLAVNEAATGSIVIEVKDESGADILGAEADIRLVKKNDKGAASYAATSLKAKAKEIDADSAIVFSFEDLKSSITNGQEIEISVKAAGFNQSAKQIKYSSDIINSVLIIMSKSANLAEIKCEPGDIGIVIMNKDGKAYKGANVNVILPGKNGSIKKNPNISMPYKDSGEKDKDGIKDGNLVIEKKLLKDYVKNGQGFRIQVNTTKNERLDKESIYKESEKNILIFTIN